MIMEGLGDFPTRGFGVAPCRRRRGEASRGRRLPAGPCQIQEFRFALTQPEGGRRDRMREQAVPCTPKRLPTAPTKPSPQRFMLLCSGRWDTWSLKNLSPASPGVRAVVHLCFHQDGHLPGSPRRAPGTGCEGCDPRDGAVPPQHSSAPWALGGSSAVMPPALPKGNAEHNPEASALSSSPLQASALRGPPSQLAHSGEPIWGGGLHPCSPV